MEGVFGDGGGDALLLRRTHTHTHTHTHTQAAFQCSSCPERLTLSLCRPCLKMDVRVMSSHTLADTPPYLSVSAVLCWNL